MLAIGAFVLHLLGTVAPGLATAIGDIWIKSRQTQVQSDANGVSAAHSYLESVTEANRSRAEARKNEGAWGPLGIVTLVVGMALGIHVAAVVADSLPLLPGFVWIAWGMIPLPALVHHETCHCVLALPGAFQQVELEAIRALFYTAPPSAAAIAIAKVFRG